MKHGLIKVSMGTLVLSAAACYGADAEVAGAGLGRTAMLQTALGLCAVIAVIYALAWLAKRTNMGALGRDKGMRVVTVLPLGTREKAVLVDIAGTQMLLGVAPGRVSTLHVFPEPVVQSAPEITRCRPNLSAKTASEFSKKLNEFLSQGNKTR